MTDKYAMLKDYINELGKIKNDDTIKDIQDLITQLDKASDSGGASATNSAGGNLIEKETFNSMTYKQRVDLKDQKPETYANAIKGNFKGEK